MCDPVSLSAGAVALSAAGQGANVFQQRRNLKAQGRHQDAVFRLNKDLAERDAIASSAALKRRQQQERASAVQQIQENARRALAARSRARTAAGEAGALGPSFEALLGSFSFREAEFATTVRQNLTNSTRQIQEGLRRIPLQQQSRILRALPAPLQRPDYLGAGLRIAGQAFESAATLELARQARE